MTCGPDNLPLALEGLERRFGDHRAVAGIDLIVAPGEFVTLLGPSGCGKTTTLNMIAGFIEPTAGRILLDGISVEGLPPFRRNVGLVFQDYALFPNMTVAENIAFGLRMRNVAKTEIATRVTAMIDTVKLTGMADRRPQSLSGGQRQRVALARALVIRPQILLLDEPLSNLDLKLREEMRVEIAQLQRRLQTPTIFVTHDQDEALSMSDRVVVMNAGRIEQSGSPAEIYERPSTRFVAEFVGAINLLSGTVIEWDRADHRVVVKTPIGRIAAAAEDDVSVGQHADIVFRPERARLGRDGQTGSLCNELRGHVVTVTYLGSRRVIRVAAAESNTMLVVDQPNDDRYGICEPGIEVTVSVTAEDCRMLAG